MTNPYVADEAFHPLLGEDVLHLAEVFLHLEPSTLAGGNDPRRVLATVLEYRERIDDRLDSSFKLRTAMKASWGTLTLPIAFMRFFPLACLFSL